MNIFATHHSAIASAFMLDDVRCRKMVLETAQLLCTAIHAQPAFNKRGLSLEFFYKPTHVNHPCALWVAEKETHFNWLMLYFHQISDEYLFRFNKNHASFIRFDKTFNSSQFLPRPATFADCTPYKGTPGTVHEHYREYLQDKWIEDVVKGRMPKWTNSVTPLWATRYREYMEQTHGTV